MVIFAYGLVCYALFLVTLLYAIGFVENLVVPKSIDSGATGPIATAVLVNIGLMGLFAVQHSIMARPWFKRWWTQYIPKAAERSTFVLATCIVFGLMFWLWRPIPGTVWDVQSPVLIAALWAISFAGWGLVLYASFLIDHFDLFGLKQVWAHIRGLTYRPPGFRMPMLYRMVRNPLMLGFLIAFWVSPTMSWGGLLFAVVVTGYIIVGVSLEERDIGRHLGEPYQRYRRQTPMLLPWPRPRKRDAEVAPTAV